MLLHRKDRSRDPVREQRSGERQEQRPLVSDEHRLGPEPMQQCSQDAKEEEIQQSGEGSRAGARTEPIEDDLENAGRRGAAERFDRRWGALRSAMRSTSIEGSRMCSGKTRAA